MRAYEFITESNMHPWHSSAVPGLKALSSDNFYELYRLGLAMASAGREGDTSSATAEGPAGEDGLTLSYSDADEKIINAALKKIGHSSVQVTPAESKEPSDTMTKSPVANLGPVKRKS